MTSIETEQSARDGRQGAHPVRPLPRGVRGGRRVQALAAPRPSTEGDDHLFCLLTMNHHPLHINDVYAAQSQQGRTSSVGPYVYALALGMSVSDISGKAHPPTSPTEELSHPNPVFHGDTLFAETEVLGVRPFRIQARPRHRQGAHACLQPGRSFSSPSSSGLCSSPGKRPRPRRPR